MIVRDSRPHRGRLPPRIFGACASLRFAKAPLTRLRRHPLHFKRLTDDFFIKKLSWVYNSPRPPGGQLRSIIIRAGTCYLKKLTAKPIVLRGWRGFVLAGLSAGRIALAIGRGLGRPLCGRPGPANTNPRQDPRQYSLDDT